MGKVVLLSYVVAVVPLWFTSLGNLSDFCRKQPRWSRRGRQRKNRETGESSDRSRNRVARAMEFRSNVQRRDRFEPQRHKGHNEGKRLVMPTLCRALRVVVVQCLRRPLVTAHQPPAFTVLTSCSNPSSVSSPSASLNGFEKRSAIRRRSVGADLVNPPETTTAVAAWSGSSRPAQWA